MSIDGTNEIAVRKELIRIIHEVTSGNGKRIEIRADSCFEDDIGMDSIELAEMVLEIDDSFDICIMESEFDEAETFEEAVKLIASKTSRIRGKEVIWA